MPPIPISTVHPTSFKNLCLQAVAALLVNEDAIVLKHPLVKYMEKQ